MPWYKSCLVLSSFVSAGSAKVAKILKVNAGAGRRSQVLLGKTLCQSALQMLLGVGTSRMSKLFKAVKKGEEPPLDGRFVTQARMFRRTKRLAGKREVVIEFLEELYNTIAEALPEINLQEPVPQNPALRFRRSRGRRPNLSAKQSRLKDKRAMRKLPPGSFSDYLALLNIRLPDHEKITLKMFSSAAAVSY